MINTIDHIINIDLANKINMNKSIIIKKNDTESHKFVVNIFNSGINYDLTGTTARIYFKKPDGTKVFLDCVIDSVLNNKISSLLTNQVLTSPGQVESEITIYGTASEILTSVTFNFTVSEVIRDDMTIESTSEFTALTNALAIVTNIALKADKTYVDSQDLLKADKTYVDSQDLLKADKTYVDSQDLLISNKVGNLPNLGTTNKTDIVSAINENVVSLANNTQQISKINLAIMDKGIIDPLSTPGNKTLLKGDSQAGFYGFVQPSEMGLITANPVGNQAYSGPNLALATGLASGTAFNDNVPLMKFAYKGKTLFIPLTGYRHSTTWDAIYNAGLVFGTSDEGFLPPAGRCGVQISINAADNSINTTTGDFLGDKTAGMDYADTVAAVGDSLTLKGWTTVADNVAVTVASITANKIVVSGVVLTTEAGNKLSRFYKTSAKITQSKIVTIGDKQYRIRLMKGAGSNPIDSFVDTDRGSTGPDNEWNSLILPLHEHAKLSNWIYPLYAKNKDGGNIINWGLGLTDENLRTLSTFGIGSYTWCQENSDTTSYRRVFRGSHGASNSNHITSWYVYNDVCWRPVLEVIL